MNTTTLIDLNDFCGDRLNTPWGVVNTTKVAASNGAILIVVDRALAKDFQQNEHIRPPRIDDIVSPISKVKHWAALPAINWCDICEGEGEILKTCRACRGNGEHECSCGDSHECCACDGTGKCESTCMCHTMIGNRQVRNSLLALINNLPQCEVGCYSKKKTDPVFFRFAGGEGAVMPLHNENE